MPFIVASAVLFYVGVAFAFFLVLPMAFNFFTKVAPTGVVVMTDIKSYLDFTIGMLFAFGLAFQVPIAIIIIVWVGLVPRRSLAKSRPYVFLACVRDRNDPHAAGRVLADAARAADVRAVRGCAVLLLAVLAG